MTKIIARSINNTVNCTFYEKSEDIYIYIIIYNISRFAQIHLLII